MIVCAVILYFAFCAKLMEFLCRDIGEKLTKREAWAIALAGIYLPMILFFAIFKDDFSDEL